MSNALSVIATYVPPDVTRNALSSPQDLLERTTFQSRHLNAAILFADVSGFTPLTEALAQKGTEGPEELTRLLNTYFTKMISLIEAEGGEVVKFSGDAVTVVFPVEDDDESLGMVTRRAKQAAVAMQTAMTAFANLKTSVGSVELGMKIGVAAGEITASQVGGVRGRWEYVISGDPLRQVAEAEHQAERGDIVLSPEAEAVIFPEVLPPQSLQPFDWHNLNNAELIEQALRRFVPGAVLVLIEEGLHDWLAELRPMSVLFIGIGGLDDQEASAIETLHNFLQSAQHIIYHYEGSINKVAVDDKGTIMIVLFGAPPFAHEDDSERALRCSLDLQTMAQDQGLQLAIGATTGRVFSGPVGSETRREYTVMGDTVNLAARLMGVAGLGGLRCDHETYRGAKNKLVFETYPPVRVKGKAGLIRIYCPIGEISLNDQPENNSQLVGRQTETDVFVKQLQALQTKPGHAHCLLIEGEAGIGKSRLVEEMIVLIREQGLTGLLGTGRSIEQKTPYRAWRDIFSSYFGLDELENPSKKRSAVEEQVRDIVPDQLDRLPLLNDILNVGIAENELTQSLDIHLRHDSLVLLLLALLRAWASERPLVLILEDAHWLDTLSWDLTLQVFRTLSTARLPIFLIVAMRPLEGNRLRIEPTALANLDTTSKLTLGALSPEETLILAASRLGLTMATLPSEIAELVRSRAGGNPFFAEELMYALRDSGLVTIEGTGDETRCIINGDLNQAAHTLPETIEGIILSRIDRLPPEQQLTLKIAAVIGRTFAFPALHTMLHAQMDITDRMLKNYLDDLVHLDLTPLEAPEPELTYIFKHIITQEVAYETLLYAQRRELHGAVATWYEQQFSTNEGTEAHQDTPDSPLAPYYPLLVYHWGRADEPEQERRYALLAGHWAAAQFANEEAVSYFTRAIELTAEEDFDSHYELLLAREVVNDLLGDREAQSGDLDSIHLLIKNSTDQRKKAELALRQANYFEVTSDYPEALRSAKEAINYANQINDIAVEAEGYIVLGKSLWRQGEYAAAHQPLEHSLGLSKQAGTIEYRAKGLYYLGHIHLYQGDYTNSQTYYSQALNLFQSIHHYPGEADSLSMLGVIRSELGDYLAASDYSEQAITICQTIGDLRGEVIILGNLGNVYWLLGDYKTAQDYQQRTYEINLIINDSWGEAFSLTNLALIHYSLSEYEKARKKSEQALEIQKRIGDRSGQGYSLTYLGLALTGIKQYEVAIQANNDAIAIRKDLGQNSLTVDNTACLAEIALATNNGTEAQAYANEILKWFDEHGADGVEFPLQAQLTCYEVLTKTNYSDTQDVPQAKKLLDQAYHTLMEQADNISDHAIRDGFLNNDKTNRTLTEAWQARNASN